MGRVRTALLAGATVLSVYGWPGRRLLRWGATDAEVAARYPGAQLVPEGRRSWTMAVTIEAPPQQVWPWLVQMGWGRGGWYSWDLLDNAGRPSAREVHPEWQDLAVGDQLRFWVLGRVADAYRVGMLEPDRFLGLFGYTDLRGRWLTPEEPPPAAYMKGLWGFLLMGQPANSTRLVVSGYEAFRPRWVEQLLVPWFQVFVVWPMQARMMAVLKRNVQRDLERNGQGAGRAATPHAGTVGST